MYRIEENRIEYSWDCARLFEKMVLRGAYYAKGRVPSPEEEDGRDAAAERLLGEDERPFAEERVADGLRTLYGLFVSVLAPASDREIVWIPDDISDGKVGGFRIVVSGGGEGINADRVALVDLDSEDYLVYGVLASWAGYCGDQEGERRFGEEQAAAGIRLERAIPVLGRPGFRRSYTQGFYE